MALQMQPEPFAGYHAHVAAAAPAVGKIAAALETFCSVESLPPDVVWKLRVALDEIVANIVSYGTRAEKSSSIDVWFSREGALVRVRIADDGPPFDPLARPDPDVTLPLHLRQVGGLGIKLVRSLMDEVHYERTSHNILTIGKRIGTDTGAGDTGSQ